MTSAPRRRRSHRQRFVIAAGGTLVVMLLVAVGGLVFVKVKSSHLRHVEVDLSHAGSNDGRAAPTDEATLPNRPLNFLVVGTDTRAAIDRNDPQAAAFLNGEASTGPGLSDSIMVVRVDPTVPSASILSIPRDLWVPIAGTTQSGKINSALARGPQSLVDTVHEAFGVPIDHFVEVDFAGFRSLVDMVGGLSVYFDVAMRDANSGVNVAQPGCVHLDGTAALALARSRHPSFRTPDGRWVSDDANDFGRIDRQQFLLKDAAGKLQRQGLLGDPVGLNHLIDTVIDTVTVDQTLASSELLALATRMRDVDPQSITSSTVPGVRWYPAPDGSDALRIDEAGAAPLLQAFGGPPPPATKATPSSGLPSTTHQSASPSTSVPPLPTGRVPEVGPPGGPPCPG